MPGRQQTGGSGGTRLSVEFMSQEVAARRRPHDLHQRLLDAGERVFVRKGFAKATIADISAEADVAVSVLYRHFGSKAELFREAILTPFVDFLREWMKNIQGTQPKPSYQVTRQLIETIFDRVGAHPHALSLLMASDVLYEPEVQHDVHAQVGEVLNSLAQLATAEVERNGMPGADRIGLHTRCVFAMVLGILQWQPWLLGADNPGNREAVIEQVTQFVWNGAAHLLGEPATEPRPNSPSQ